MPETSPGLPPGVLVSWSLVGTSGRGRRPTVGVADIVSAGITLADADGLAGVSMPSVARRVGLTQNALYRHVASKDELLVLMADAANGEPPHLAEADWRTNAQAWVTAVRDRYLSHPWLLDIRLRAPYTRNTVRWTEEFLRVTRNTGLPVDQRIDCATLLDGHARHTVALARDLAGQPEPGYSHALITLLTPLLKRDGCTEFAAFLSEIAPATAPPADGDADFGLARILDGIDAFISGRPGR